ncbi:hypothetical protein Vretimale_3161 [Volvox reticuliferus]|uniref:Uncharacterized protein n=1 Tax=Volvox reticuliferus TaxID=1737510 RepID=A0A8J4FMR8_9CHLO|nr:hypothetical protein Vretifemale_6581 [Volvox reticuliferus]GIL97499.1 hypothetical protein Vretimale_3161 [Volvox reticuliferus]
MQRVLSIPMHRDCKLPSNARLRCLLTYTRRIAQALKLPHRAKEITALLSATLNQLERDKAQLKLDPVSDRIHCLGFALRIFDNADRVDRAGRATERTSRAFYAASVFIEILNQFDSCVDNELLEKQRYCAWRAAEILKAIREGRQPTPPPSAAPPAGAGPGPTAVTDLPPASGSSDWAYGSQNQANTPLLPPPEGGGGSFSGTSELSFGSNMGLSSTNLNVLDGRRGLSSTSLPPLHERAPPPSVCSSFGQEDAAAAAVGTSVYSSTARFWPGTRLLVQTEEGLEEEGAMDGSGASGDTVHPPGTKVGTVGQVIRRQDGGYSYKVALTDRLIEVPDEAAVPVLQESGVACLLPQQQPAGQQQPAPVTVKVLLINYASWPPTYLIQTPDGKEHAVAAHQLMPPPRENNTAATATALPAPQLPSQPVASAPAFVPPPQPLHTQQQQQQHLPPSAMPSAPPVPPHPAFGAGTPSAPGPYPSVASSHAPPAPAAPQGYQHSYPSAAPAHAVASAPYAGAPFTPPLPPGYKPPLQVITDAQKQAKYAVSALSFEDIHTAVKHLSEALRLLTSPPPPPGTHHSHGR